ncbi:DNA glycosylase AlkZ-like family protein [Sorangium sp. So ce726]|uniref:DNA glycosylase AlkZ-like family protein n=1 Tax=Sorangium sp. So ce726 TaxID=3133319 RepID=UPI003F5EEA36
MTEAASSVVGLHSARIPSAFFSAHARVVDFAPSDLYDALYASHQLFKLRCMRGTLHIVPLAFAPVVHAATLRARLGPSKAALRYLGIKPRHLARAKDRLIEALSDGPKSPKFLCAYLAGYETTAARTIIKYLWENGTLCYVNTSETWEGESRKFALTRTQYPSLCLNAMSETSATAALVMSHISAFGPVSVEDVVWWCGMSKRRVMDVISQAKSDLTYLTVPGIGDSLLLSTKHVDSLRDRSALAEPWVRVLAHEDPSLKGYFSTRNRYASARTAARLFNAIGEARASVVVNGRVVALWSWDRQARHARPQFIGSASATCHRMVVQECERVAERFRHREIFHQQCSTSA